MPKTNAAKRYKARKRRELSELKKTIKSLPPEERAIEESKLAERRQQAINSWRANMQRSEEKKQAAKEYADFMEQWRAKWAHLKTRTKKNRKVIEKRRNKRIKNQTVNAPAVKALVMQIQSLPQTCYWCKCSLPNGATVDHVTPVSKGGLHCVSNIVPSCGPCNSEKTDVMPSELGVLL